MVSSQNSQEDNIQFIELIINEIIDDSLPRIKKELTLEDASKCLTVLGKIWNLNQTSTNNQNDKCNHEMMDMDGYVEDYQYLKISAVDMDLTDVKVIPENFIWLIEVDLTGNKLKNNDTKVLSGMANLVSLKLDKNQFSDPYIPCIKHLQYLGLGDNKITSTHRIYQMNLETLEMNYNCVGDDGVKKEDCGKLKRLQQLELRGNRLTTTDGLNYITLTRLYLAQNMIDNLSGIENLINLELLHLRNNPLDNLNGFSYENSKLNYLNIRECKIENIDEIGKLSVLPALKILIIKDNLFCKNDEEKYGEEETEEDEDEDDIKLQILAMLPSLTRIDKKLISYQDRRLASRTHLGQD